jgi:nucleotide-binding universal stress UspA family protein
MAPSPERTLHFCAGITLGRDAEAAVTFIRSLRQGMPLDVTFVHLYSQAEQCARLGIDADPASEEQVAEILERQLRERIGMVPGAGGVELRIRPRFDEAGPALVAEAAFERADCVLIALHPRRELSRMLHGGIGRLLLREARIPVLLVPALSPRVVRPLKPFRHVLCATDLSPLAERAVQYAYALANTTGSTVELCYVHAPPMPQPVSVFVTMGELTLEERARIEATLRNQVPTDRAADGVETRTTIVEASKPDLAIVQAAERSGADAICIASHGRTGLRRALLGSVAGGVMQKASVPVFVVPASVQGEEPS